MENFSPRIKEYLQKAHKERVLVIEEHKVYRKIQGAKKPNSMVSGNLPKKVVIEYAVELSEPLAIIHIKIASTFDYQKQCIQEEQTPIPTVHPPLDENDIRNISGTPFFSKNYESFLTDWTDKNQKLSDHHSIGSGCQMTNY